MIRAVTEWWAMREPRERVLLAVLGGLALVFLLVFALLLPLQDARARASAELDRARADLVAASRLSPAVDPSSRAPFDRAVLVNIARAADIRLTRVQPGQDGSLSVWIDDAQTLALYGFFEDLLTDYTASMDSVIVSSDANGRLSAQFVVR
ncbi:MAG: type II secretion system protein GspM [Pseudomonadota bacterium]